MRAAVPSRRLGARLSRYRTERGLSGTQVAAELGIGQPQLSRIETGKAKVTPAALARLIELLGIPEAEAGKLEELRRHSTEPGWWQDYGDILSEPVEMLIELEVHASWIRGYDGHLIPGLLQTREYAERIITASAEAVYVDGQTSWTVHERDGVIRQYGHAFASVQAQALPPRESLDLIHTTIKELAAATARCGTASAPPARC